MAIVKCSQLVLMVQVLHEAIHEPAFFAAGTNAGTGAGSELWHCELATPSSSPAPSSIKNSHGYSDKSSASGASSKPWHCGLATPRPSSCTSDTPEIDMPDFMLYLQTGACLDNAQTRKDYVMWMQRFFSMVEITGAEPLSHVALVAIHKQKIIEQLRVLPILAGVESYDRKLYTALNHYVSFMLKVSDDNEDNITSQHLGRMSRSFVAWKKQVGNTKTKKNACRYNYDALRTRDFLAQGWAAIKLGITLAMIDLWGIYTEHHADESLSPHLRGIANTIIIGIIYLNGFAGRLQEWANLTVKQIKQMLKKNRRWFTPTDYKTNHKYGHLAKLLFSLVP